MKIVRSGIENAPKILEIQKEAFLDQSKIYNNKVLPPLTQSLEDLINDFNKYFFFAALVDDQIVGSVKSKFDGNTCHIGRLCVKKKYQNIGIGKQLMNSVECFYNDVKRFELFTGKKSLKNIDLYKKLGYTIFKQVEIDEILTLLYFEKIV